MAAGFSITISAVDQASARIEAVNKRLAAMRAPAERLQKQLATFSRLSGLQDVGRGFERMARGARSAFQSVARVVSPLAAITSAASLAGMYRMVEAWGQWGSHLGFAATRIGLSAEQLQTFQGAAVLAGASTGGMTAGLQALGQSMYDAIGGRAPETVALFNQLGIAFDDGTRHTRSLAAVLPEVANKIAAIRDPYTQARVAAQLFGGSAEELLPFLRRGARGILDLEERTRRYGVTNAAGVAAANRMREAQADLSLAVTGLGNSISERLAPILAPLLDQMANWIAVNRTWIATGIGKYVGQFAAYVKSVDFGAVVAGFDGFAHRADGVAQAFGGWKRVLESIVAIKLVSWAAAAIAPFTSILRLLVLIPGSGVTAGALAALGIAAVGVKVANRVMGHVGTQGDVRDDHSTAVGRFLYDHVSPLRYADNWLNGSATSARQSAPSAAIQAANLARSIAIFQSRGFTRAQAAGMAANIGAESSFDPAAVGDSGKAYGIGQWHADRQAAFAKWAGHNIRGSGFAEQAKFYAYELTKGGERAAGDRLRATSSPFQAGQAVSLYDERPQDADGSVARSRGLRAMSIFDSLPFDGSPGATGKVDVTIHHDGAAKVIARSKGNVNPPKIMTANVGSGNGGS